MKITFDGKDLSKLPEIVRKATIKAYNENIQKQVDKFTPEIKKNNGVIKKEVLNGINNYTITGIPTDLEKRIAATLR